MLKGPAAASAVKVRRDGEIPTQLQDQTGGRHTQGALHRTSILTVFNTMRKTSKAGQKEFQSLFFSSCCDNVRSRERERVFSVGPHNLRNIVKVKVRGQKLGALS